MIVEQIEDGALIVTQISSYSLSNIGFVGRVVPAGRPGVQDDLVTVEFSAVTEERVPDTRVAFTFNGTVIDVLGYQIRGQLHYSLLREAEPGCACIASEIRMDGTFDMWVH
jgi:hypothetical protein